MDKWQADWDFRIPIVRKPGSGLEAKEAEGTLPSELTGGYGDGLFGGGGFVDQGIGVAAALDFGVGERVPGRDMEAS
jgi:hypothetical protein